LVDQSEAYQAQLEMLRANPLDEELEELVEVAKRDLEIAWLEDTLKP
jgi:hypothetical protein